MAPILILFGISGVGKTTAARRISARYPQVLTFQASSLLKSALAQSGEALRTAAHDQIAANQTVLAGALDAARSESMDRPVMLDAHSVIDNDRTLVPLPLETFSPLRPEGIAVLTADPEMIAERRSAGERIRPARSTAELTQHQAQALAVAKSHALALGVPFASFDTEDEDGLRRFVAAVLRLPACPH